MSVASVSFSLKILPITKYSITTFLLLLLGVLSVRLQPLNAERFFQERNLSESVYQKILVFKCVLMDAHQI
jgi:hypothetical protein